ncbi:MAG: caspase family protein [Pseudomonadota bacterium]
MMWRSIANIIAFTLLSMVGSLFFAASVATAQNRLALVVGIDEYDNVPSLLKARNDAHAVAATLESVGFSVTKELDTDRRSFSRAISAFVAKIQPGDEAVFYFAGHGVEVDGRNLLLPSDIPYVRPNEKNFLVNESIPADRVLNDIEARGARVTVLILDACRNNPFPTEGGRSVGSRSGLGRMDPPKGSFVIFSAGTGEEALDRLSNSDPNPNSVFTRALLPRIRQPGLAIHDLVQEVRHDVEELAETVGHEQFPAFYDQLSGEFSFNPREALYNDSTKPTIVSPEPLIVPQLADPCEAARADWQVLSATQSISALEEFTRKYPSCSIYVAAARDRITTLSVSRNQATVVPQTPTSPTSGDVCSRLWYERNLIFHNNGYCFQTARAKAVFDTTQCTGRSPSLTSFEKSEVARIQAAERANGC